MLFPEVADAIADLMVMTAQAQERPLAEFVDSLNLDGTSADDRQRWNQTMLALIGESRLARVDPKSAPAN